MLEGPLRTTWSKCLLRLHPDLIAARSATAATHNSEALAVLHSALQAVGPPTDTASTFLWSPAKGTNIVATLSSLSFHVVKRDEPALMHVRVPLAPGGAVASDRRSVRRWLLLGLASFSANVTGQDVSVLRKAVDEIEPPSGGRVDGVGSGGAVLTSSEPHWRAAATSSEESAAFRDVFLRQLDQVTNVGSRSFVGTREEAARLDRREAAKLPPDAPLPAALPMLSPDSMWSPFLPRSSREHHLHRLRQRLLDLRLDEWVEKPLLVARDADDPLLHTQTLGHVHMTAHELHTLDDRQLGDLLVARAAKTSDDTIMDVIAAALDEAAGRLDFRACRVTGHLLRAAPVLIALSAVEDPMPLTGLDVRIVDVGDTASGGSLVLADEARLEVLIRAEATLASGALASDLARLAPQLARMRLVAARLAATESTVHRLARGLAHSLGLRAVNVLAGPLRTQSSSAVLQEDTLVLAGSGSGDDDGAALPPPPPRLTSASVTLTWLSHVVYCMADLARDSRALLDALPRHLQPSWVTLTLGAPRYAWKLDGKTNLPLLEVPLDCTVETVRRLIDGDLSLPLDSPPHASSADGQAD